MKVCTHNNFDQASLTTFPLINAVLTGKQEGKIVCTDREELLFTLHKSGFSYLFDVDKRRYEEVLKFLTESLVTPKYFHLYDAPEELINVCLGAPELVNIKVRNRIQLKCKKYRQVSPKFSLQHLYFLERINTINFDHLDLFGLTIADKFWGSKADFLENGFGFIVKEGDGVPVSICYAACIADGTAEIDVATLPGHQKKGLAGWAITAFVNHCVENNITANWDCFEANIASLKAAYSAGFSTEKGYSFLSIFNKKKKDEIV